MIRRAAASARSYTYLELVPKREGIVKTDWLGDMAARKMQRLVD
jgi:hypothetical protein